MHQGYYQNIGAADMAQLQATMQAIELACNSIQVEQAVQGSHGLDVQFVGINFLESLVSEFSPSTSTAMGLPREFHEQCRISLEQDYMKAFYCWVQYAAFNVSDRIIGANSEIPEVKVCSAALRLMLQILNWDFRGKNSIEKSKRGMDIFYDGMKQESDSLRRSECILVQQLDASGHKHSLPPEGISAAANLFALIVESELRAASASAFNDEDEYDYLQASIAAMDERLSSYALIARAAIGATIPLLKELFSERVMRLHQEVFAIAYTSTWQLLTLE
ncbi:UNVERIFIED_CONTAM: hypothetical protein Sradi_1601700 [Sesamum radiatum]|uniref:Uncharacterized protein n=1 Tax=Sesamum radiatum TaxID=300843 RepID=A0AAW2UCD7_SESRA